MTHPLDDIGMMLEKRKDEAIAWKSQYESRITAARRQYLDSTTKLDSVKSGAVASVPEFRRGVDNITKTKVRKNAARIGDMLFPTNDSNYSVEPSPVPDADGLDPDMPVAAPVDPIAPEGQGGAAVEPEAQNDEIADQSAAAMQEQLKDYLDEAVYSAVGRATVDEGCLTGTGVIRGPFPKTVVRKASITLQTPMGPLTKIVRKAKIVPFVENVEIDNFFPQPAKTMKECSYVFQLHMMTKAQVADLIKDGFDEGQVRELLANEPDAGALLTRPSIQSNQNIQAILRDRYAVWQYAGPLPNECLEYFGFPAEEGALTERNGEAWFCQGKTLKAALREIDGLPYHVWNYEKDPESIFGYGVPHACADDQYDVNYAWNIAKLNAFMSAMPITGILKDAYSTELNGNEWPPTKPLLLKGDKLSDVIQFAVVPSVMDGAMAVYNQAKQNADEHTMMPMIEEGMPSNVQVGAAVMAMIQTGNNVVQRYAAKSWDDNITMSLMPQMIEFELLYGDNEKAKGAFDVIPKASSHLLEKDMKAQHLMSLLQLSGDPNNAALFKRRDIIEDLVHAMDSPASKYLNSPEEEAKIQQQMAQQPNPEMAKIEAQKEIEQMKIQGNMKAIKLKAQSDQLVAQMSLEAASIKAASDETMNAQELDSRARIAALTAQSKQFSESLKDQRERSKDAAKMTLEAEKLASKEAGDRMEVATENKVQLA